MTGISSLNIYYYYYYYLLLLITYSHALCMWRWAIRKHLDPSFISGHYRVHLRNRLRAL